MNVLEKILEEIEERVNMVKNIPVNEDDDFLDGEECYEAGRIQGRYEELVWCRNIIRSHMDEVLEMALYPPTEKAPRPARRKRAQVFAWLSTSQYRPTCLTAHTNCSKSTGFWM